MLGAGKYFFFSFHCFVLLPVCEAEGRRKKRSFPIFLHTTTLHHLTDIFCCILDTLFNKDPLSKVTVNQKTEGN